MPARAFLVSRTRACSRTGVVVEDITVVNAVNDALAPLGAQLTRLSDVPTLVERIGP